MANMLSKSRYKIDFFTFNTFIGNLSFNDPFIKVHNYSCNDTSLQSFLLKLLRFISNSIKRFVNGFLPLTVQIESEGKKLRHTLSTYAESIASNIDITHYKCFIGVEPAGMMVAGILGAKFSVPFVYYNMELHTIADIISPYEWAAKSIERDFQVKALFTITQDDERARIMMAENSIPADNFITIPVCADGAPFKNKTDMLRSKFGFGSDKIIVLYAGFIGEWAMCEEMVAAAKSWPDKYVLVLHSHGINNNAYINKLKKNAGRNVFFSDVPISYDELSAFLASADVGVALYKDLGANFTLISSASGKLAHYLKSGLPVIVNSYPGISRIMDQYKCGLAIDDPNAIVDAINKICDNYEEMHQGAFNCYENEYRFSRHFEKILKKLEQL
jgi:glycosyltransferase involved in cell wall biosynthesis